MGRTLKRVTPTTTPDSENTETSTDGLPGSPENPEILFRVNVKHDSTVKEGWRHTSSIEFEWDTRTPTADILKQMTKLMQDVDTLARVESHRRNLLDGRG